MKKRIFLLIYLSFFVSTVFSMDPPISGDALSLVLDVLTGKTSFSSFLSYVHGSESDASFAFSALPKDLRLMIIDLVVRNAYAGTLEEAVNTIRALTEVNKELNDFINQPAYCLAIIKNLSERFNCSNEFAARVLNSKGAKERLELQAHLDKIHVLKDFFHPSEMVIDALIKDGIDLDFTYDITTSDKSKIYAITPLVRCIANQELELALLLIKKGADINKTDSLLKLTPLMECSHKLYYEEYFDFFKYLIHLPNVNINQTNHKGDTAFHMFLYMKIFLAGGDDIDLSRTIQIVDLFLKAGADPELVDNQGFTPLELIKKYLPDKRLITMIENAIQEKRVD